MKIIRYAMFAVLVALFALAAANWTAFSTPTRLSLLFTEFELPLGLLLLAVTAGLTLLFLVHVASLRTSMLIESRRLVRELEQQRALADQAESSRFSELRVLFEQHAQAFEERLENAAATFAERIDTHEQGVRSALEELTNTLSAHIGQVDDKLERALDTRTA